MVIFIELCHYASRPAYSPYVPDMEEEEVVEPFDISIRDLFYYKEGPDGMGDVCFKPGEVEEDLER